MGIVGGIVGVNGAKTRAHVISLIEVKDFKILRERLSLVVIFSSVISKNGAFSSDLKGVVMKNFSGGKPTDPHFCSLRSHLVSAPPI